MKNIINQVCNYKNNGVNNNDNNSKNKYPKQNKEN